MSGSRVLPVVQASRGRECPTQHKGGGPIIRATFLPLLPTFTCQTFALTSSHVFAGLLPNYTCATAKQTHSQLGPSHVGAPASTHSRVALTHGSGCLPEREKERETEREQRESTSHYASHYVPCPTFCIFGEQPAGQEFSHNVQYVIFLLVICCFVVTLLQFVLLPFEADGESVC